MKENRYELFITYFHKDVLEIDKEIESVLGSFYRSGYHLFSGERNLHYYFKTKKSLKTAIVKVKGLRRRIKIKIIDLKTEEFISLKDINK